MYKNSFVHYLTKVLVDIMFYGGILSCVALPFLMPALSDLFGYSRLTTTPFTAIVLVSGLCALFLLWQLKAIFKTLLGGNPFVDKNVDCLRKSSVASFLIAMVYIVKSIFWFTIASTVFAIVFALLGLFCLTLKDIFKQAIAFKEENDWTV